MVCFNACWDHLTVNRFHPSLCEEFNKKSTPVDEFRDDLSVNKQIRDGRYYLSRIPTETKYINLRDSLGSLKYAFRGSAKRFIYCCLCEIYCPDILDKKCVSRRNSAPFKMYISDLIMLDKTIDGLYKYIDLGAKMKTLLVKAG